VTPLAVASTQVPAMAFSLTQDYTMISRQDQIYGAVLLRSIREGVVQHISDPKDHPGHFVLDGGRHVLIKEASGSRGQFRFTFSAQAITQLLNCLGKDGMFSTYLLLVGNGDLVCELSPGEWLKILEVDAPPASQTLRVIGRPNHSFRVAGPNGELDRTIPKNRFPSFGSRIMS